MTAAVEVVVPYAGTDPDRAAAADWVLRRYVTRFPAWKVTLASDRPLHEPDQPGPWVKANAVNPAVAVSTARIVVVADADVWCDAVDEAVLAVGSGKYAWAAPHWRTHRFTPDFTRRVLAGGTEPGDHTETSLLERPYHGIAGGGLVVLNRSVAVGVPLDPRFEGWGGEDVSWGWALRTLAGKPWRGAAPLYHLWHTPQDRPARTVLPPGNDALRRRYYTARGKRRTMQLLLDEAVTRPGRDLSDG